MVLRRFIGEGRQHDATKDLPDAPYDKEARRISVLGKRMRLASFYSRQGTDVRRNKIIYRNLRSLAAEGMSTPSSSGKIIKDGNYDITGWELTGTI